ncbi:Spermidine Putrescine ABC transporter permease component potC [Salmonella enterica subsp. enterica]|uniref:Spermidine Putrescine ABC transporter permease component potC n=1 Tax=Salmonella enterica I TaxID=59201 RepID=A0A379WVB5_SALET|nr:Spermidine Putrescine ABC transporter permease component potC [Salmonella enterica subsp. enterica]
MMSPDIVMAISLLVLFMLLGIQLGFWSLLFSHITFSLPFVVVTVYSRLKGFDVRMLEAAKDLGASEVTILRQNHSAAGDAGGGGGLVAELYVVDGRCRGLVVCHRAGL